MEVSLKDLSRIESAVDKEIEHVTRRVNIFRARKTGSSDDALESGIKLAKDIIEKYKVLLDVRFYIRGLKAEINQNEGIKSRTADLAKLVAYQEFLDDNIQNVGDPDREHRYGSSDEVKYHWGIDDDFREELRTESKGLTRQIQRLKDSCAGINANLKVTIPEDKVTYLRSFGLVD